MFHLPEAFRDLEPLTEWALPTERERADKRHSSTMEEITHFYDTLMPRMSDVLDLLAQHTNEEDAPEEVRRLFWMTLSLAEIGTSVEWFGQPGVIQGFDYRRYSLVEEAVGGPST